MKTLIAIIFLFFVISSVAFCAPLFPDVPENHWARDAVANLSAKGILEGYPDGTFKGDRAATRWEMAMCLSRFLAKMEAEHAKFATKADLDALRVLVGNLRDELEALGIRVKNLEDNVSAIDKRVEELERITFEGEFVTNFTTIGIRNSGKTGTNWNVDVGGVGALNFGRGNKLGAIDIFNGRPFINGASFTTRARLGVKVKLSNEFYMGLRLASYTSLGSQYIDAYWGVNAPYLSNHFASNGYGGPQGITNSPWTRLTLDSMMLEHKPSGLKLTVGSISETNMDNSVVSRVPNPNISGKSMAKFTERIVEDKKKDEVVTLKYYEDEETYLPFYGIQLKGKAKTLGNMTWEVLYSKLPFGANPTATTTQNVNDVTQPQLVAINGKWLIKDQGALKLNYAHVDEMNISGVNIIPNHGNYWFWTDPISERGKPINKRPMRGSAFISAQCQDSYGISIQYRFEPSNIRFVAAWSGSRYQPNKESSYVANGNHFRVGVGWTNPANTLRLDLEYINTDPYYDAFQLYFQPLGEMSLGGVPPGTPIAFAVVPAYFGGFPGSYIPFGYQLHDSGLYPNNREGIRFGATYRFPQGKGSANFRLVELRQHTVSSHHLCTDGILRGLPPGFIDPVFHTLNTNGAKMFETPRGRQEQIGGDISYKFTPQLKGMAQYDFFRFMRSTDYASWTATAKRNFVNLSYNVFKLGLEYSFSKKFTLKGGYNFGSVKGYHPALATLVKVNAGDTILNIEQSCPYLGFDYILNDSTTWTLNARAIDTVDKVRDTLSPESYNGFQLMSSFNVKF